ncbi:MAG: alpha/beta hydrolase-fold protein [Gordonia sp. (in: high G+C Gram-positive bacteria)]|uniref:alpha/beta hydrolase-fold protein n=1 Tax=Gordonia sp. (in: high G+C Gram-positive bacteria) TaxID=84139 RepID=UPI0039E5403F
MTSHDYRPNRRHLLQGAAGLVSLAALTACGAAESAQPAEPEDLLGGDELPTQTQAPPAPGGPVPVTGTFVSQAMAGRPVRWAAVRPTGVTGTLPVVVVAHALNTDESTIFGQRMNMQRVLQDYVDAGGPPFALASADVGRNYYHLRTDGADGAAMIINEFLPMLGADHRLDLRVDRYGLFGWSMGGYGALRIGSLVGAPKIAAIAVSSPAMWADPTAYAPRAFDSYDDYVANSLFGQQNKFARIPVMISIGSADQFYTYTRQWAADLHPPAAFGTSPGGHTPRYWRSVLPEQVEFLGRNLALSNPRH